MPLKEKKWKNKHKKNISENIIIVMLLSDFTQTPDVCGNRPCAQPGERTESCSDCSLLFQLIFKVTHLSLFQSKPQLRFFCCRLLFGFLKVSDHFAIFSNLFSQISYFLCGIRMTSACGSHRSWTLTFSDRSTPLLYTCMYTYKYMHTQLRMYVQIKTDTARMT